MGLTKQFNTPLPTFSDLVDKQMFVSVWSGDVKSVLRCISTNLLIKQEKIKKHGYFLRSDLLAKTSAIDTPIQIHAYSTTNYYLIGNADQ